MEILPTENNMKMLTYQLETIRGLVGIPQHTMAHELGVTRQTMYNLEHGKVPMTKYYYIAIMHILTKYLKGNEELESIVCLLLGLEHGNN